MTASRSARQRLTKPMLIAVTVLLLTLAGLWIVTRRAGGTWGLNDAPSGTLLATIADASRLTQSAAGPAVHVGADGMSADRTTREYRVPAVAPARAALLRACLDTGLSPPNAEDRRLMPDLVCQGQWHGGESTVHLNGRCETSCVVTIETRIN